MTGQNKQNVMAISLLAGLAGAGLGLLVAPRSGRETRERMRLAASDAKHSTKERLAETRGKLDDQVDKANETKTRWLEQIRSATKRKSKRTDETENRPEDGSGESPIIKAWNEEV